MPQVINMNIASLNAQRNLNQSQSALQTSLQRLSSGLRINNAYEDAAGLAIADKLERDVRVANQAIRNANDGISALAIGEKALGKVTDILTRLSELSSESATGTVPGASSGGLAQGTGPSSAQSTLTVPGSSWKRRIPSRTRAGRSSSATRSP